MASVSRSPGMNRASHELPEGPVFETNWRRCLSPAVFRVLFWFVFLIIIVLSLAPVEHPDFSPNDKVNHILAWGALAMLGCLGWTVQLRLVLALWCASFALEGAQGLTGYRMFSLADAVANGVGLLAGLTIITLWERLKPRINPTQ